VFRKENQTPSSSKPKKPQTYTLWELVIRERAKRNRWIYL
jgi:hypothetical protein